PRILVPLRKSPKSSEPITRKVAAFSAPWGTKRCPGMCPPESLRPVRVSHPRRMVGARRNADAAKSATTDALAEGKRRTSERARVQALPSALLALQREAGNGAVNALLSARLRWPGPQARSDIDAGLREMRHDEPAVEPVEAGLKAAKALGIPVELEGPKPPASA